MNADVIILGSGFAGSLLAAILARQGMRVVLLDRDHHPRFAIGESSTPIADLLLSHLASRWDLPDVAPLARWGTWRKTYPEIGCGLSSLGRVPIHRYSNARCITPRGRQFDRR
jgi:FADH2 O2-dependent halogenase